MYPFSFDKIQWLVLLIGDARFQDCLFQQVDLGSLISQKERTSRFYLHFVITVLYKEMRTIHFLPVTCKRIPASSSLQILNFNQQHCNFMKGRWFVDFRNFDKFSCGIIVSFIVFLHVFMWCCSFDPAPSFKKCCRTIFKYNYLINDLTCILFPYRQMSAFWWKCQAKRFFFWDTAN